MQDRSQQPDRGRILWPTQIYVNSTEGQVSNLGREVYEAALQALLAAEPGHPITPEDEMTASAIEQIALTALENVLFSGRGPERITVVQKVPDKSEVQPDDGNTLTACFIVQRITDDP